MNDSKPNGDGLIDPADALRLLRAKQHDLEAMLETYGNVGPAEQSIVEELATMAPLAHPRLFNDAHRRALYSIEVLDRNGGRQVTIGRLGPLRPVAMFLVGRLTSWIVRGHQRRLISSMRRLYERREAITDSMSEEHNLLRRARFHTARLEADYRGKGFVLPAFLVGGAAFSAIASTLEGLFYSVFDSPLGNVIIGLVMCVVLFALAWSALQAAGVARRRIRMTTDATIPVLWDVIGSCGNPPRDQSYAFAALAMVLAVVFWLAVPATIFFIFGI